MKSAVAPELIEALPRTQYKGDPTPDLKTHLKNKGGVVLDIDLLFGRKGIKPALPRPAQPNIAASKSSRAASA